LGRNVLLYRRAEEGAEHPEEADIDFEPTLAQNVVGQTALQFDHWAPPAARLGQDAIFVLPRPQGRSRFVELTQPHFDRMEKVERVSVDRLGIHLMDADIYVCRGYRGPLAAR
jgi:hypothetical protein